MQQPKTLTIVGLYRQDLIGETMQTLHTAGAVWTLNDWYRCYPWMVPDCLFNLHIGNHTHPDNERFSDDWKWHYNEAGRKGTKIVVGTIIPGVDTKYQVLFNEWDTIPIYWRQIEVMTYLAAKSFGYERIIHRGVRLRDDEYRGQIIGMVEVLDRLRSDGVEIINAHENEWAEALTKQVDWENLSDGYKPYWDTKFKKMNYEIN